jgi:hypothetical protein
MTASTSMNLLFPVAGGGDSDDVRWALETASAMWARGDGREALRWLRRAAESAAEEGLDLRAVELAKSAAELRAQLDIEPSVPPPPPAAHVSPAGAHDGAGRPPAESFERSAQPSADELPPVRPPMRTEPGLSASDAPPAPGTELSGQAGPGVHGASPPEPAEDPEDFPQGPSFISHQAIRVAVTTSADQPGILTARILKAGERVPPGTREALFLALEPGVELFLES